MINQLSKHAAAVLDTASPEYLERLVKGIDPKLITELVKHNRYLQQRVFPGFRPNHLPWDYVPARLAQDVHLHPATPARTALLKLWLDSNRDLCNEVEQVVNVDKIEEDVLNLLVKLKTDKRDRLLWALLLDEREEIQLALANGLCDALINESSALMVRADRALLIGQLEKANQETRVLKEQLSKLENRDRLLSHKVEEFDNLQNELKTLKDAKEHEEVQSQRELHQKEAELQRTIAEKYTIQQEMKELQDTLNQEKAHTTKLQNDINDLRVSLDITVASREESASEVERRLNETLKLLEDQRRDNTLLQQRLNKAERDKATAYEKRDEERNWREYAESHQEKLKSDKVVLIKQRREDHKILERLRDELSQMQLALSVEKETQQSLFTLLEVDESWNEAVEELADHLTLPHPSQGLVSSPIPFHEKIEDWQAWQQAELTSIRPLLAAATPISAENLVDVVRAQKLLVLRWYLLECLKLSLTETLSDSNRVKERIK